MADGSSRAQRPLSPHLQIYRPLFTMMMSIVHRITGVGLYFGMVLLVWWLLAAASNTPSAFNSFSGIAGSFIGLIVLLGFTWALLHHAIGGLRHFMWDFIYGFEPKTRELLAKATLAGSIGLTLVLWVIGVALKG